MIPGAAGNVAINANAAFTQNLDFESPAAGNTRDAAAGITGAQVLAFAPPALPGSTGGPPLQFIIRSTGDYQSLAGVLDQMQTAARESGMFIFVDSDLEWASFTADRVAKFLLQKTDRTSFTETTSPGE